MERSLFLYKCMNHGYSSVWASRTISLTFLLLPLPHPCFIAHMPVNSWVWDFLPNSLHPKDGSYTTSLTMYTFNIPTNWVKLPLKIFPLPFMIKDMFSINKNARIKGLLLLVKMWKISTHYLPPSKSKLKKWK